MQRSSKLVSKGNSRLAASDWVEAALHTMARRGIASVRIEVLAKDLKVTKGSFYWHFKDRNALFDAMLVGYEAQASEYMEKELAAAHSPLDRLRSMLAAPRRMADRDLADPVRMELAIRSWARRSVHVRNVVRRMDEGRGEKILAVLLANGVKPGRVRPLKNLLSAVLFHLWTRDDLSAAERDELIELFIGLVN